MRTKEGKKKWCYLTYGKPLKIIPKINPEDSFQIAVCEVAGCYITSKQVLKIEVHNFFVSIRQKLKFGFGWENRFWEACQKSNLPEVRGVCPDFMAPEL